MGNHHRQHSPRQPSWASLKDQGLSERHVLMAIELGFNPGTLVVAYNASRTSGDHLLLEWIEDASFAKFGRYIPMDESATPDSQAEHQAENTLLPDPAKIAEDYLRDHEDTEGDHEEIQRRIWESEKETPVSYGEIHEEDQHMLRRQENFRKAARLLTKMLAAMAQVQKVVLFGSVAMPLWKEVPRFARLHSRKVKVFHECQNIDLAVWVNSAAGADAFRRAHATTVNELVANDIHFSIAHHHFSTHLIDHLSGKYLGMVCHYAQCPKQKPECLVQGCGASKFVRVFPWFRLKPERLNSRNSQLLFER